MEEATLKRQLLNFKERLELEKAQNKSMASLAAADTTKHYYQGKARMCEQCLAGINKILEQP